MSTKKEDYLKENIPNLEFEEVKKVDHNYEFKSDPKELTSMSYAVLKEATRISGYKPDASGGVSKVETFGEPGDIIIQEYKRTILTREEFEKKFEGKIGGNVTPEQSLHSVARIPTGTKDFKLITADGSEKTFTAEDLIVKEAEGKYSRVRKWESGLEYNRLQQDIKKTIDKSKGLILSGSGTEENPYIVGDQAYSDIYSVTKFMRGIAEDKQTPLFYNYKGGKFVAGNITYGSQPQQQLSGTPYKVKEDIYREEPPEVGRSKEQQEEDLLKKVCSLLLSNDGTILKNQFFPVPGSENLSKKEQEALKEYLRDSRIVTKDGKTFVEQNIHQDEKYISIDILKNQYGDIAKDYIEAEKNTRHIHNYMEDKDHLEELLAKFQDIWMKYNQSSKITHPELFLPYEQLKENQKQIVKGLAQSIINIVKEDIKKKSTEELYKSEDISILKFISKAPNTPGYVAQEDHDPDAQDFDMDKNEWVHGTSPASPQFWHVPVASDLKFVKGEVANDNYSMGEGAGEYIWYRKREGNTESLNQRVLRDNIEGSIERDDVKRFEYLFQGIDKLDKRKENATAEELALYAIKHDSGKCAKFLIDKIPHLDKINGYGELILHEAVEHHISSVETIIKKGANPNSVDGVGDRPLDKILREGENFQEELKRKEKQQKMSTQAVEEAIKKYGTVWAERVNTLIDNGADPKFIKGDIIGVAKQFENEKTVTKLESLGVKEFKSKRKEEEHQTGLTFSESIHHLAEKLGLISKVCNTSSPKMEAGVTKLGKLMRKFQKPNSLGIPTKPLTAEEALPVVNEIKEEFPTDDMQIKLNSPH